MKYLLATLLVMLATPLQAHPGHVEMVAGHTHSIAELLLMSAAIAVPVLAALVFAFPQAKRVKK